MLGFLIAIGIISIIVIAIFITITVYKSFAINHSNRIKKIIEITNIDFMILLVIIKNIHMIMRIFIMIYQNRII